MNDLKLFMVMLGCTPKGRNTEQHDIFFGIGNSLKDLIPQMSLFWKEAKLHIDAWREVTSVDGYSIEIKHKKDVSEINQQEKLFFINLGGYKENEFEEYHYKILCVANDKGAAVHKSKQTAFYKHYGFKGAESHIDDKYGIDVDDVYEINDVLSIQLKNKYSLLLNANENKREDELNIGYVRLEKL